MQQWGGIVVLPYCCVIRGAAPYPLGSARRVYEKPGEKERLIDSLRREVTEHLALIGVENIGKHGHLPTLNKDTIRRRHVIQKREIGVRERAALGTAIGTKLIHYFAEGWEVDPRRIQPELIPVNSGEWTGQLFRLATLFWSVPVSRGYGRRVRFLIVNQANMRLIGLLALGDPVFNLRVRDEWIGWSKHDRVERLVNVMDAYVVGAVPPYAQLLGGKLIVSLMASAEVAAHIERKYAGRIGEISKKAKGDMLALTTVTSALGRSSLYNRVRLPGLVELNRIGETQGWGHFQIPNAQFEKMRQLLQLNGHKYATGYKFGQGANWRMRVIREALHQIGLDGDLLRHGIAREVFAMPLAETWREFLQGKCEGLLSKRPSAQDLTQMALARWVIPRSERRPDYRDWTREDTLRLLGCWRT